MEANSHNGADFSKKRVLIRVSPRYLRLRQGSEIRYTLKLFRPINKGRAVTIHVCVIMNKCGVSVNPQQIVVTSSDWKLPREIVVTSEADSDIRTIQIHHKIYDTFDDVYNANTVIPSVFVSVLQKEATFLFSFGCGLHGRLGSNDEENANVPTPFASKWLHPVQIACGKAHSAIIDVNSNIYCFGLGTSGQLGQGDSNLDSSKIPLRVPTVGASTILQVTCGSHHTMCMTAEGKVFAWGDNSCGQLGLGFKSPKPRGIPTRVEKLVNVRSIVCGGSHSFIIMLDNNVLACGSNIAGQLGLGDRKDRSVFERMPFFRKLFVSQFGGTTGSATAAGAMQTNNVIGDVEIACGLYHSMALCGKCVYSWGNGDDGRLGHRNLETYLEPTQIAALNDIPIKAIACGGSHSGALAVNGDVYLWGNGQHGQLGTGSLRSRRTPARIRSLHGKNVTQLSFGEWHSMALCEDGVLFSWGFGEEGQLGLPDEDKKHNRIVAQPSVVHALSGTGATIVRCGGSHTFVVSVMEARRSQFARIKRAGSQTDISKENDRIAMLSRSGPSKLPPGGTSDSEKKLLHSQNDATKEDSETETPSDAKEKMMHHPEAPAAPVKKKAPPPRLNSSPRDLDETAPPRMPVDFSWRDRPMTTRAAVRSAFRQEVKVLAEMRESFAPIPVPTRAKSANAFISPRLKRLHDQVLRDTEAGAGLLKCENIRNTEEVRSSIACAVQMATKTFCSSASGGFSVKARSPRAQEQTVDPEYLAKMLRELRGAASKPFADNQGADDSNSTGSALSLLSEDDEITFTAGNGRRACSALEREVVWRLSSP